MLSPHLNFHRPGLFAAAVADANGKTRKVYRDRDADTPCERLKSLDGAERFPKPGVSFAALDAQAHAASDLESARRVHRERARLLRAIRAKWPSAAVARRLVHTLTPLGHKLHRNNHLRPLPITGLPGEEPAVSTSPLPTPSQALPLKAHFGIGTGSKVPARGEERGGSGAPVRADRGYNPCRPRFAGAGPAAGASFRETRPGPATRSDPMDRRP